MCLSLDIWMLKWESLSFFFVTQHNKHRTHQIQSDRSAQVQEEHQKLVTDADLDTTATHADTLVTIWETIRIWSLANNSEASSQPETNLICLESEHILTVLIIFTDTESDMSA